METFEEIDETGAFIQPADAPDLYPKKFRKEIDEFNDWLFPHIHLEQPQLGRTQSQKRHTVRGRIHQPAEGQTLILKLV